jgi:coenzyme PQQ synthesis protein D (PqqD)
MDRKNDEDALAAMPSVARNLDVRAAGNESLVHDPATGKVHVLNGVAARILGRCDGTTPLSRIVDEVAAATGADRDRVAGDVLQIYADFRDKGLLT